MATAPTPPVPNPGKIPVPMPPPAPAGAPQSATVDEVEGGEIGLERSFWQIPFVQDILPFITSLVIHLALISLGLITAYAADKLRKSMAENAPPPENREEYIVPSEVITDGPVGGVLNPGLGGDPNREARQNVFKDVPADSQGINDKPNSMAIQPMGGGGEGDASDENALAVGPGGGTFGGGKGKGTGRGLGVGEGLGNGTGDGMGAPAPFGAPGGGGGIGPKSPFVGVSGNAMRVVYLCDSSGSMLTKFDKLREELNKAVAILKPIQSFDIIFFAKDSYKALDQQLVAATPDNKRKALEFLNGVATEGSSDPIPGIKAAFATNPQLIYMLTDGDFPNNEQVIAAIRQLNASKKVKINTIAFMERGESYEKLLSTVARENGGMFKFVTEQELDK